jgi:type 1 glutamine amidotransferase
MNAANPDTMSAMFFLRWFFCMVLIGLVPAFAEVRLLIVDGVNNHDWAAGSAAIKAILAEAGGFQVDLATVTAQQVEQWRPEFSKYQVVINNFNSGHTSEGLACPTRVEKELEDFVRRGGGLVSFHAANNAFLSWAAYNEMIGLGWRDPDFGEGLAVSDDGTVIRIPKGEGLKPGHPKREDFVVHVREQKHPVTKGLPEEWVQPMDQLTHGQHGPAAGLTILTYAYSPVSKRNEPMDWVRNYGKGRVYVTMLGHTWKGEAYPNLKVPEFWKMFAQGVAWTATGK